MTTRFLATLSLLLAFGMSARCQTLADYQFSTGHDASRWYTLDSTRNLLVITGSRYYVRSSLEDIGFSFPFADTSYTQFSVTHDGNLRLGSALAISSSNNQGSPFHPLRAGTNNPKINFMGCAGYTSDSAFVHRQVFGQAPQRVLVVEFALQTYVTSSRHSLLRWQVQMHENGDIQIVYPSQAPPIVPHANHQQGLCVDETDVWTVDEDHIATHYTSGCSTYIPLGYWPDTNRYYRFDFPNGVCASPVGAVVAAIDTSSVTLAWNGNYDAMSYVVDYATTLIVPGSGVGSQLHVSDTFVTITGLQAGVQYHFYVRSVCSEGDTSSAAYLPAQVATVAPVSIFPYSCDFEDADERGAWYIPVGNLSTLWCIGSAANNTENGQYGLYVSQDGGLTNTGGEQWVGSYAYRDMNLEAGDWTVTFDWRAVGDWFEVSVGNVNYYHFMRAFLVPSTVTFTAQTPATFPSSPHSTGVPNGWIELNPTSHAFVNQSSWTTYSVTATVPTVGCYHLMFYWETDGYEPAIDMPAAIDNIYIERLSCAQPQMLTAAVTEDEVLLTWQRGGSENQWMVRYGNVEEYTTDTFYLATDLNFNTWYTFDVYAICGVGDTSDAASGTFCTAQGSPVTDFPYFCDFEDTLECRHWITLGMGQQNSWYTGTAANNTAGGQRALYVSQDNGVTNTYSGASSSISYACRVMVLDSGEYVCSFDWRCMGDADYHFFRAFVVPVSAIPSAGSFPITNNHYSGIPAGWTDLAPQNHYLSGQSDWTTLIQPFTITDSGEYALLMMWENDDYTPGNPPAAVDNISIERILCPIPTGLNATMLPTSIDLTWDAVGDAYIWLVEYGDTAIITYAPAYSFSNLMPNTEYQFRVRTLCVSGDTSLAATLTINTPCLPIDTLPYFCDFESYATGTGNDGNFIPCWHRVLNYNSYSPRISDQFVTGNKCLYWNLTVGLLDDAIVVLPELSTSIEVRYTELRFKAKKLDFMGMYDTPVVYVGVMDDPYTAESFFTVDSVVVTNDSSFEQYSVQLLSFTGQGGFVAIRCTATGVVNTPVSFLMDDVELHELQYCHKPSAMTAEAGVDTIAVSWSPGGDEAEWIVTYGDTIVSTHQPNHVARGLQEDMQYSFSVAAICSIGDTSEVLTGLFRTQPRPQDPPDTVECNRPTDVVTYQETPYTSHAYQFTFYWSGDAPAYEIRIENLHRPDMVIDVTTTDTSYFFDAEGVAGQWIWAVRSVCGEDVNSGWSDTTYFETPICIGVDAPVESDGILLFPNPSSGSVSLVIVGQTGLATVAVTDLTGREVLMPHTFDCLSENTETLMLDGIPAGVYFVRVDVSGYSIVRKLIVK